MERSKYIISFLIFLLVGKVVCFSQSSYKQAIYNAYVNGDMSKWKVTLNKMESDSLSVEGTLELLNYYYGYIGYMIGIDKSKTATLYIKKGEKLIDEILKNDPQNPTANAYKGSFIAFKIAISKLKAVTMGPQSMKYINKANKLDYTNVQALTDKGNMLYYAPSMFGGNKKEAIIYFEKAIKQMEINNENNNWFYLYLLTSLAQYNQEMGNKEDALSVYEKILAKEPNLKWVRDEFYQALLESM
ncbi:MAG: tetratricopeptide repeat protein [Bacteroides sp.]|nr:tetratricopeptide repeat protein [Bacteroides sp.]